MNVFRRVLSFIYGRVVRPGLDGFLERYIELAKDTVIQVIRSNPNVPFHELKREVFQQLKIVTAQSKDTWISILVDLAYESLRATRK
jgi:hypothetical protein